MTTGLINLAHSPLGASAAERYINCPGSPRLVQKLGRRPEGAEPEYTRKGIGAHKVVAWCLSNYEEVWEALGRNWGMTFDLDEMRSMQAYVDIVRARIVAIKEEYGPATIFVEFGFHRPELHALFYGTFDVAIVAGDYAEVIDYKHGAGIAVDITIPQLRMYAVGFVLDMPEVRRVRVRIVQPRAWHPDGPDRTELIEVPELMQWLDTELLPAMEEADPRVTWDERRLEQGLNPGEWCRFCPAARGCSALTQRLEVYQNTELATTIQGAGDEELGRLYEMIPVVRFKIKAVEQEVHRRNLADPKNLVPGSKLVRAISHRVWKPEAEAELRKKLPGLELYTKPELKSPAQVEELSSTAEALVKEWAYTPETGYSTVPISNKRKAVTLERPEEIYQRYLDENPVGQ